MPTLRHKNYRSLYHPTLPKLAACKIQQHFFSSGSGDCEHWEGFWWLSLASGARIRLCFAAQSWQSQEAVPPVAGCCSTEKCVLHTFSQFGHQTVDTLSEETEASIVSILLQRIPSAGVWQTSLASGITCCQGREMAVIGKAVH